jgi:hypothetical protein
MIAGTKAKEIITRGIHAHFKLNKYDFNVYLIK